MIERDALPSLGAAPWHFRFVKALTRRQIRGSWRLPPMLRRSGLWNRAVLYRLSPSVLIEVPIGREVNCWDHADLADYEVELLRALEGPIQQLGEPVTLVDGGADIGVFSLKLICRCPSIRRILAFEPNPDAFVWLERNLKRLPFPAEAVPGALSDFIGRGELRRPDDDPISDHAMYLSPAPSGTVSVTTVDSLGLAEGGSLVVKLDLEGGELAALRGSERTVRAAARVVAVFEAHPRVAARNKTDPLECLRLLGSWRDFRFFVGEQPGTVLSCDRPVFEQIAPDRVYNIIGQSI